MDAILGFGLFFLVIIVLIVVFGHIKGPPEPSSMTVEAIISRINSESSWLERYKMLPYERKQGEGIKKQHKDKKLYVMRLNLELMKRFGDASSPDAMLLQRTIGLIQTGLEEDTAYQQASNEIVLPVAQRSKELIEKGMNEDEAREQAIKELLKNN